ncbi:hypothetical protein [Xylocopilactobacillus apicola]|uniref:Uncharacterized protein n=1 Tax=Xylocopilactobacillus apicola TaxID=2932184 RepID=A0AAU9DWX3_9LACO|nr:hypothetical protein [Xylocopilactobacillus apicola]BDR58541.1 hypothetical protein XA3_09820 [Xylocopilactobacillus apicola]BDR58563.1 hypothetical protein XA3_10040 [Xylocopilactobacillus apicola]
MSAVLIFNLVLIVVLFIERNTLDHTDSSQLISNYYLSDTIRRLCPEDQEYFETDQGTVNKKDGTVTVKLKNGYKRIFKR